MVHVHVRSSGLAAVAVCDQEYPARVAFTLLMKMQDDFMAAYPESTWMNASDELQFPALDEMVRKYQDPHEADTIMKIQRDLDETKIILHKTIDSVLERGVKLDNLVEKSTDLSAQSKMYVARVRLCMVPLCLHIYFVSITAECLVDSDSFHPCDSFCQCRRSPKFNLGFTR